MLVSNRCARSCDRNRLHKIKAKIKANTLVIILSTNESPHLVCQNSLPISFNRKLENIFGLIVAYCCIPLSPVIGVLSSRVVFCCLQVATIGLSCFSDSTNHSVEALCSQFLLFARGAGVAEACALWRWRKHANERRRQQERGGRMGRRWRCSGLMQQQ